MSNAYFKVPDPVNEPVRAYQAGSAEKKSLKAKLAQMAAEEIEIPLIIGGQEIKTDTRLGVDFAVDDLFEEGYKAIYLAIGAHKGLNLQIPGEEAGGVRQGVDFLREVNLGGTTRVGSKVAIITGGPGVQFSVLGS